MTMPLPDAGPHPTAQEPAEFVDAHRAGAPGDLRSDVPERQVGPTARLDPQTRVDIAYWAEQYISHLVENHRGGRDDVRAVIHDLNLETNVIDTNEGEGP